MKRTRKKKNYNRISLGTIHREVLYKEFEGISRQSIDNALNYKTDSDLGRSIRAKAKELLKEEVKKLKIELDEQPNFRQANSDDDRERVFRTIRNH